MRCDSCEMLMINGVPCHERGCPRGGDRYDSDTQTWVAQYVCRECGCTVDRTDDCCNGEPDLEDLV